MATLRQYFETDSKVLKVASGMHLKCDVGELDIQVQVHHDYDANVKYASAFVPASPFTLSACNYLVTNVEAVLAADKGIEIQSGFRGLVEHSSASLKFSGRLFIYVEDNLSEGEKSFLNALAAEKGVSVSLRGQDYARARSEGERPNAFVCHDSRDKDVIARPIAEGLQKLMCPVWYDEYSLKVGDSLRESIEKGIRECGRCIVVISPRFISNTGWTRTEFDSIFTRQIVERKKLLLPVWHRVTTRQVFEYSPILADRVGLKWSLGADEVCRRLYNAINAS